MRIVVGNVDISSHKVEYSVFGPLLGDYSFHGILFPMYLPLFGRLTFITGIRFLSGNVIVVILVLTGCLGYTVYGKLSF